MTRLRKIKRTGTTSATAIEEWSYPFIGEVFIETWIAMIDSIGVMMNSDVPALTIVRIVATEEVELRRNCDIANIPRVVGEYFKLATIGSHPGHPAAMQRHDSTIRPLCGLHPEITDRNVKPAVDSHATAIRRVVRAAGMTKSHTQILEKHLVLISHPIARRIAKRTQKRRVNQIKSIPHKVPAPRTVDLGDKINEAIRLPVAISITTSHDLAHIFVFPQRSIPIARNINSAIGRRRNCSGIFDLKGLGPS